MQILPINKNNQTNFQAVNQKYLQMAKKEAKGVQSFSEIFFRIEMDVCWKDMHPQDAIDTLQEIKKLLPNPRKDIEMTIEYVKKHLDSMKK